VSAGGVAITGLGVVAPNGDSVERFWANCLGGVSGIDRIQKVDCSGLDVDYGGEVVGFDATRYVSRRDAERFDPTQVWTAAAAAMALDDATVDVGSYGPERIGITIGTGAGPLPAHRAAWEADRRAGPKAVSPYYSAAGTTSMCAGVAARTLGILGPTVSASGACATGAVSVVAAAQMLAAGDADLVLAGAADAAISRAGLAAFGHMRALARHDEPRLASRPLDLDRNGFVLAEGAAALVLERPAEARARGARIYACVEGYGIATDASDLVASGSAGIVRAGRLALTRAGTTASDVDHLSLHAAGTRAGDVAEARALHELLGRRAAEIPSTAPKSMLGHAMGTASAFELVLLAKTFETRQVPPTINLDRPDPAIRLQACTRAVSTTVRCALKTSIGLGGVNVALLLRAPSAGR
jgi:3-oxoacyl-[acyl-carrier-protein] synthase II